jgi:hypothetical protein
VTSRSRGTGREHTNPSNAGRTPGEPDRRTSERTAYHNDCDRSCTDGRQRSLRGIFVRARADRCTAGRLCRHTNGRRRTRHCAPTTPGTRTTPKRRTSKYYTNPVGLGTGREFLGLRADVSAKQKVFVATIASDSVTSLLSGKTVPHDIGVLPRRRGETSLLGLIQRTLRDYRSRR